MKSGLVGIGVGICLVGSLGCRDDAVRGEGDDDTATTGMADSGEGDTATTGDDTDEPEDDDDPDDDDDDPTEFDNPWERAQLRRLTTAQYTNAVIDLLGERVDVPDDIEQDLVLSLYANVGASEVSTSEGGVEKYELAAIDIASQVFSDPAWRDQVVRCDPEVGNCVRQFITDFGRRAFRRPMTTEEIDRYALAAAQVTVLQGSPWSGLQYALAAILQSPHFVYIVEIGEEHPETGRRRYSSHEMAARLAFFLWDSVPDTALDSRADVGMLVDKDIIEEEARRMLADPKARRAFARFFDEYLTLAAVESVVKDPEIYPQVTPELLTAMRGEVLRLAEEIAFVDGNLLTLLDADRSFVTADLAMLYGIAAPTDGLDEEGFGQVWLPEGRRGILGTGAFLAVNGRVTRTSPTLRGVFVQSRLLCYDLPPPPPDVDGELPTPPSGEHVTMRELLAEHSTNESCATCHNFVDPIGLALEHYDGIGEYREDDQGLTLDVTAELEGEPFEGMTGLTELLAVHPGVTECMARQFYRHAVGQLENTELEPVLVSLGEKLGEGGHDFEQWVVDLVLDEGFRFQAPVAGEGE